MQLRTGLSIGIISLVLAGCGGGGGSSRAPAPTTPPTPPPAGNAAPTASFTVSPGSGGSAPLNVTMNAANSSDSDGSIASYEWNFGDAGNTAIGQTARYTYTAAGSYTISLTVTDDEGDTGTASATVQVDGSGGNGTVSGTIRILGSSAIDADVHDRLTTISSNNSFDDAQSLPNPVTLGGFANLPNTGAATGNLFTSGDPGDFYRINLTGSERILLNVAEGDADLDLRLYNDSRALVDASIGDNATESLNVTQSGSYFIEVVPVAGASNYVLSVGLNINASNLGERPISRLSDPFVAGEVIVNGASATNPALARMRRVSGGGARTEVSVSRPQALSPPARQLLQRDYLQALPAGAQVNAAQALRLQTLMAAKALRRSGMVANAEVNGLRQPLLVPDDPFYDFQWHYRNINLPLAWDVTTGSSDVIVAVVDTGVLLNHPDLNDRLVPGYDFIADAARARDGDGIDADPNDPGDLSFGGSSSFHGTHVAGTIGAESNNGSGATGVDWAARIMPMRALGVDGGTTFDVLQAMRFAAGLSNDSGTTPSQRADIINLSLGSEFSSQSEQNTINEIRALGVLMVASAGNESSELPSYPAAYDGVVSVAATTINNAAASYSNFGPSIDLAAPGGDTGTDLNGDGIGDGVVSTIGEDGSAGPVEFGYAALNGTSMAAPHVAGVMALMKAVHPALTPQEFDNALMAGDLTNDLGAPGRDDTFGYGLIIAQQAVITALNLANGQGSDPGPVLAASASSLNFGAFGTQLELTVANVGTGALQIASVSSDEPWLSIDASAADSNGLGTYQLNVDRAGLADGTYSAQVSIDSDANDTQVSIIMQVASANQAADAGLHFVILVDSSGTSTLPAAVVNASNGEYAFTMTNIPFGQYQVFAGTDSDDDNFLCDDGEACGAFRTLDEPATLSVNGDVSDVEFVSSFRGSLSSVAQLSTGTAARNGIRFERPAPQPQAPTEEQ
ncbi:MAG: S8 family serine peptidase [Pseudomonadales bacterium]